MSSCHMKSNCTPARKLKEGVGRCSPKHHLATCNWTCSSLRSGKILPWSTTESLAEGTISLLRPVEHECACDMLMAARWLPC